MSNVHFKLQSNMHKVSYKNPQATTTSDPQQAMWKSGILLWQKQGSATSFGNHGTCKNLQMS